MSWKASAAAKEITHGQNGEKLSMADKLVLMVLSENYLEDKGYVWCSQELLSKHCVCSTRGLRGILERLARFKLVGIVHRNKLGNYYTLEFMRNPVPHKVTLDEEPHAVYEERGAVYEERGALYEEQLVPPVLLTVKTVDSRRASSCEPEEDLKTSERDIRALWAEMRKVFKRKVHRSLGTGLSGRYGDDFLELVRKHGTDKVLAGFESFVEGESKQWLKKMYMPAVGFVRKAEEWIDDASIEIEESPTQVAGPRGVGAAYAHLVK